MTAPKIYRYDDTNAPVVNGQRGSAISLLKACLVDGYGDKPAAGWTMPYSDAAGKAVFRGNPYTGTGFYLQLDNTGTSSNIVLINAYENMTDVSTGVKRFIDGSSPILNLGLSTSTTTNTTPRPWILFADDRFFILCIWQATTLSQFASNMTDRTGIDGGYSRVTIFGDGIPLQSSDSFFCLLLPGKTSDFALPLQESGSSGSYIYVARDSAGDENKQCSLTTGGGPLCISAYGPLYHDNLPTRVAGQEIVSRPYINDGKVYTMRGYLPGLWLACHRATDFDQFEILEIGSHRFMVVKCMNNNAVYRIVFLIDISEHWRP